MAQNATEDMLSIVVIIGDLKLTGFGPGGAIRFVKTTPNVTMRTGVGGLTSFTRVLNEEGTLSIDLLPTSDGNDALSIMERFAKDRAGGVLFAVSVRDIAGRFSLSTAAAAIMKQPDVTIGDGSGLNTWDLLGNWRRFTGGKGPTPIRTFQDAKSAVIQGIPVPEAVGNI